MGRTERFLRKLDALWCLLISRDYIVVGRHQGKLVVDSENLGVMLEKLAPIVSSVIDSTAEWEARNESSTNRKV